MKHFFYTVILIIVTLQVYAQKTNGKVIDAQNTTALENVNIFNSDGTFSTKSDINGMFSLPKSGTYTFSVNNYESATINIKNNKNNVVRLTKIPVSLNEVVITSNNFKSERNKIPSAISVITPTAINNNNSTNIESLLKFTAGVYMHSGTLTTNRITIRGIGARNLYGTSKIRAYYEDIPLTNGSGASTIEDIEMNTLGRVEILKGPSSSIYGAGLGGTIQLIPKKGFYQEKAVTASYTFGDFGLQKYMLNANLGGMNSTTNITYSNLHSNGYRENNKTDRQSITATTKHQLNDKNRLTFVGNYTDLKAFIPSSINNDAFLNKPTTAAFTWKKAQGFEDYKKLLFGLSWQHNYNGKTKQYTSIFYSHLDTYEARPFNILTEKTNGFGIRTKLISKNTLLNKNLDWIIGGEFFNDTNNYQTYKNLYKDFTPSIGSVKGNLLSDFKEKRSYFNLFLDTKYQLFKNTLFTLGVNINSTSYKLSDFTTTGKNQSGNYSFKTMVSPKIGLTHQLNNNTTLYSSISHGFSPPTLEETLLPNGLINTNIKPETGWNYEIGSRNSLLKNKLFLDIAIYKMNVKNLLVARRTAADEFIGVNAGKTVYNGLELSVNYKILHNNIFKIYNTNAFAFNNFKFKEFIDDTNNYSGNKLTGVPKTTFNTNLSIDSKIGFYAFLNYNFVDKTPMKDDNSIFSDTYQLVNIKIGYKSNEDKKLQFNVFIGINNVFNTKYAAMLLINAPSFGGKAPRYYYPGKPINYYFGANLKYRL